MAATHLHVKFARAFHQENVNANQTRNLSGEESKTHNVSSNRFTSSSDKTAAPNVKVTDFKDLPEHIQKSANAAKQAVKDLFPL